MLLRQENYRCTQHSEYWLLRCRLSVPDLTYSEGSRPDHCFGDISDGSRYGMFPDTDDTIHREK